MQVFLNHEDKGDYFFIMAPEGGIFFLPSDLREIGLEDIPASAFFLIEGEEYVRLGSFGGVTYEVEEEEAVLHITAEPRLFQKHVVDLSYRSLVKAERISSKTTFLNYSVTYDADNEFDFSALSIPWELGVNIKGFFGFTSFSYRKTNLEESFVRLMSNVTRDDTSRLRRYVFGDFFANSGLLGSGGNFAGVSLFSQYSISPHFISSPGLDLSGVAASPSEVDVYVNDSKIRTESVAPGEFEFKNLLQLSGAGTSKIVIRDAFGREEVIESPFYLSAALLKPGLHDYSYNLGFKRGRFGLESFEYGGPAFLGRHRFGFTRSVTLGARGEADDETVNAGPLARFILWRLGEFDTSAALSHENGEVGYGGSVSYLYATRGFSIRGSANGFSREYSTLNISAPQDKTRFSWSVGLGFSQRHLGSISGNYRVVNKYEGPDTRTTTLFYARRLIRTLNLTVTASRVKTAGPFGRVDDGVFAVLNYFFRNGDSGTLNYSAQDGKTTESINYQKNQPFGTGLSYNLFADRQEDFQGDKELGGSAFVQYRGPYGTYSANYRRTFGRNSYSLNTSGAVSLVGGTVHLTRSIRDSLALVRVGRRKGVTVQYNNQDVGRTNRNGELVVPDIISYYPSNFSFSADDLPLNYEVGETSRYASTSFRGGGVVNFEVKKVQGLTGRFFVVENGEKRGAEYGELRVETDRETVETIVGVGGEFYLENLLPGSYPARLSLRDFECTVEITIPDSEEVFVDIGEVSCEMD